MNSSKKTLKAALVMVMALLLLTQAILPMSVMGSNRDSISDYQFYSVKSGDTLTKIARNFGVTTSDIMTANNMSNGNKITTGTVIKIPLSSSSGTGKGTFVTTNLSLNVVDATVKDVLTAIALNAGYTIIFVGDASKTITVTLEQMSALKAVDYVTRLADLTYLKDGNTLMVGTAQQLNTTFTDKIVYTKFTLNYITVEALMTSASTLGITSVQFLKTGDNQREVYLSAYPKDLAKMSELIEKLDVSTNVMPGSTMITSNFTAIELTNIKADEFRALLTELGLDDGITMASRPYTLFVYVTGKALADIKTIKSIVDVPLSGANLDAVQKPTEATTAPTTEKPTESPTEPTTGGGQTPQDPNENLPRVFKKITFENMDMDFAKQILMKFDPKASIYNDGKMTKAFWAYCTEKAYYEGQAEITDIDSKTDSMDKSFFVYPLKNYTAAEMLKRLSSLDLEGVTFKQSDYEATSKTLFIYCSFSMQEYLKKTLKRMDEEIVTDSNDWRTVESGKDESVNKARISLLRDLYPGVIPGEKQFRFEMVPDKTGQDQKCITFVDATPEKCDQIKALLKDLDNT